MKDVSLSDFLEALVVTTNPITKTKDIGLVILERDDLYKDLIAKLDDLKFPYHEFISNKRDSSQKGAILVPIIDNNSLNWLSNIEGTEKGLVILVAFGGREAEIFEKIGPQIGPVYRYGVKNGQI